MPTQLALAFFYVWRSNTYLSISLTNLNLPTYDSQAC